ncbi:MAG TPA: VWA domain-containing protein [Thermoanaerobaculia bacterium]|nr:VWA domain-containing protein [Thermoanaerobaculia bacterium]
MRRTRRSPRLRARWAAGAVLALGLVARLVAGSPPTGSLEVTLTNPPARQPVFGTIELRAEVRSEEPLRWVEFFVDGSSAGRVESAPWALEVDVGQDNVDHEFRVLAEDVLGARAEHGISTLRIPIDDVVDVSLLQLYVSVTDDQGMAVPGLAVSDFEVSSGRGQAERVVTFAGGELPVSSVLLLDTSESMAGEPLTAALAGAEGWVRQTQGEDETMLALFSDRLLGATAFLAPGAALGEAVQGISATGGSAIHDALYYALNRVEPRLGRRVIVLLSDGLDVSSAFDMEDVLWRSRRSQTVIYWLRLGADGEAPLYASSWRHADANLRQLELLEQAVRDSGGREIRVARPERIEGAFRQVLEELRSQYVLGIHPARRRYDGSWRPLRVRVRGGADVRTRAGFID